MTITPTLNAVPEDHPPNSARVGTGWQKRHSLSVRVLHWINALALACLLMSWLQIFNAHPALYWGSISNFDAPVLAMTAQEDDDGNATAGRTTIGGHAFDTTGWLGASKGQDGSLVERGFPSWITLPGEENLAVGRRWHFFFAWLFVLSGLAYLFIGLFNRHIPRDLVPRRAELAHIGRAILDHARLRFPKGDEALRYNVLQNLTYLAIIFVVLPLAFLTGLTMSPGMDARLPFLLDLFGGRQCARTIHFVMAWTIVGFVVVHVALVIASGLWNNLRSMVTGWYVIEPDMEEAAHE